MSNTPTNPKDQVRAALMTLRPGRSPADGNRAIRAILSQFGATSINDLDTAYYKDVIAAVTVLPSSIDHYGTIEDVSAPITPEEFYGVVTDIPVKDAKRHGIHLPLPPLPRPPIRRKGTHIVRVSSPLTIDLEARLRDRAGKPRSKPSHIVNTGNASRDGDQDDSAVLDFPAGERVS